MTKFSAWLLLLAGLVGIVGCGKDTHEQVAREYIDVMDELVRTCSSIPDSNAAKQAKKKIGDLLSQLKELKVRSGDLGDADEKTRSSIEAKYKEKFASLSQKFSETFDVIQKEKKEVAEVLESEFKTLASLVNAKPLKIK